MNSESVNAADQNRARRATSLGTQRPQMPLPINIDEQIANYVTRKMFNFFQKHCKHAKIDYSPLQCRPLSSESFTTVNTLINKFFAMVDIDHSATDIFCREICEQLNYRDVSERSFSQQTSSAMSPSWSTLKISKPAYDAMQRHAEKLRKLENGLDIKAHEISRTQVATDVGTIGSIAASVIDAANPISEITAPAIEDHEICIIC